MGLLAIVSMSPLPGKGFMGVDTISISTASTAYSTS
jgi:hypothetical protein